MLKKLWTLLLVCIFLMSFFTFPVSAETEKGFEVLNISEEAVIAKYDGINITNITANIFGQIEADELRKYSSIVIDKNVLEKIDNKMILDLLDNDFLFMIYGKDVSMETLTDFLGNNSFTLENDEITTKFTSAVYVAKTKNKTQYGMIVDINENFEVEDEEGIVLFAEDFFKKHEVDQAQHDPLSFLYDIIITQDNGFVVTSSFPPSGWDSIEFNWWYDMSPFGKMRGLVYCYKLEHGPSTSYWDFLSAMTAAADNTNSVVDWYKIRLDVNFSGQQELDWTYLESDRSSFTVSLQYGALPIVSYTTSTSSQQLGNYIYTNAVEWVSSINWGGTPPYGQAFKIEPGIRASNTSGNMVLRRYYQSQFYHVQYGTARTDFLYSTVYLSDR